MRKYHKTKGGLVRVALLSLKECPQCVDRCGDQSAFVSAGISGDIKLKAFSCNMLLLGAELIFELFLLQMIFLFVRFNCYYRKCAFK